ncbi:DNA/RNA non-specific endonuclease [Methylobacterium durans]|uniref:DNA/RNA non-specific endonuclease n=1 Tax=Methylobacterium durans TaxID=2202825 RepID=UPI002AFF8320|nr:DNA/RNA non-specific endonuclease [Methylobacterium durans]MEA1835245.1 DNA/RNA non-specific endonuclease [Methylobacterium durans]
MRARQVAGSIAVALIALATSSEAAVPDGAGTCPALYLDGATPVLTNANLATRTLPLCFDAYAVLHSGVSRTPLYAAEHLSRASVAAARRVDREDAFHDEERVPPDERARIEDYVRSGYDRGHMAPAGDMPSAESQAQSFSLANIVPQNRAFNRGLWSAIEESVRRLASQRGDLYVVTGPVFEGDSVEAIKGRVLVPTQIFKAVYDPKRGEAGAYLAPNRADGTWRAVSLKTLNTVAGIDVFPTLPERVKADIMDLPEPREFSRGEPGETHRTDDWQSWLKSELFRALRRALRDALRSLF